MRKRDRPASQECRDDQICSALWLCSFEKTRRLAISHATRWAGPSSVDWPSVPADRGRRPPFPIALSLSSLMSGLSTKIIGVEGNSSNAALNITCTERSSS